MARLAEFLVASPSAVNILRGNI